jgi:hypothetical protein
LTIIKDVVLGEDSNILSDSISSSFYVCDRVGTNYYKEVRSGSGGLSLDQAQKDRFIRSFSFLVRADFQVAVSGISFSGENFSDNVFST